MRRFLLFLLLGCFLSLAVARAEAPASTLFAGFVQNKGQWNPNVLFATELPQGWFFLERGGFAYNFFEPAYFNLEEETADLPVYKGHAVRIELIGANPKAAVSTHQTLPTLRNYFIGSDPARHATNVPASEEVRFGAVFPKTDLKLYAQGGKLKYDFVVQPGGQVSAIKMKYQGASQLSLQKGRLVIRTSVNEFAEEKPYAYQLINGVQKEVPCVFTLQGDVVGFSITGSYDPQLPLVIDPDIIFITYTGSNGTPNAMSANSATADESGNTYAAGQMLGFQYPVTVGAYQTTRKGSNLAISKFNPTGTQLLYATFLGGSREEYPLGLVVSKNDELVILGSTYSPDFPISAQAYDKVLNNGSTQNADFFVSKLNATGNNLLASTYMGGSGSEVFTSTYPAGLALDKEGNVVFASSTYSSDFPMVNPIQGAYRGNFDGVVVKLNSTLTSLLWSSYLGGVGAEFFSDVKIGPTSGHLYLVGNTDSNDLITTPGVLNQKYVGGRDGYLMVVDMSKRQVVAATYLGTTSTDLAQLLALDQAENVYVAGYTAGRYPVTGGAYSTPVGAGGHFIHKMNKALTTSYYSTHLGSNNNLSAAEAVPTAFQVDECGGLYLTAYSLPGSPVTQDAFYLDRRNLYLSQLSADAKELVYGSFFGGSIFGHIHRANHGYISKDGTFYHIECASGKTVAATPNAYSAGGTSGFDGIITKIDFNAPKKLEVGIKEIAPVCAPGTVQFENLFEGTESFRWDFNDGSPASTEPNPIHTFRTPGKYRVQLTAEGASGCSAVTTAFVEVEVLRQLEAPNIITPNADGKNDVFRLSNNGPGTRLKVYNRWGSLVYESKEYANDWGGDRLPEGTYYYTAEAPDGCQPLKGWLEIIR